MSKSNKKQGKKPEQKKKKNALKKPDKKTVIIIVSVIAALIVIAGVAFAVNHMIEKNADSAYFFTDNGGACTLDIYTGDEAQSINVEYGTRFAPDTSNELMKDFTGTSGTLELEANMHYSFTFFENVAKDYKSFDANKAIRNDTIKLPKS